MVTTALYWWYAEGIEPDDVGVWLVRHTCSKDEVMEQLRAAIRAFVKTDEGQEVVKHNCGDFNWGDAVNLIPDTHWQQFGIVTIDPLVSDQERMVNHDERFTEDEDD